jgi:hypothetical protein
MSNFALTVDNAIDELFYADGNNLQALKGYIIEFIVHNGIEIMPSKSFSRLGESSQLNNEVMKASLQSSTKLYKGFNEQPHLDFSMDTHIGNPPARFPLNEDRVVIHFHDFEHMCTYGWTPKFTCARREWKLHLNPRKDGYVQYRLSADFWNEVVIVDYDLNIRNHSDMASFRNEATDGDLPGGGISRRKLLNEKDHLLSNDTLTIDVYIRPQSPVL